MKIKKYILFITLMLLTIGGALAFTFNPTPETFSSISSIMSALIGNYPVASCPVQNMWMVRYGWQNSTCTPINETSLTLYTTMNTINLTLNSTINIAIQANATATQANITATGAIKNNTTATLSGLNITSGYFYTPIVIPSVLTKGAMYYNTTTSKPCWYNGTGWYQSNLSVC